MDPEEFSEADGGPSRRSVLRATASLSGAVGLAGCTSNLDDGGDGGGNDGETGTASTETGTVTTETDSPTPTDYPTPAFDQDCLPLDPEAVEIEEFGDDQYRLVAESGSLLVFDEFENAKRARDVVQFYGFTQNCFVGRPNPPMQYWLTDEGPPVKRAEDAVENEDCISFDPETVEVVEDGEKWLLATDDSRMLLFEAFENARRARDVIRHYGFTHYCFVGRPNPPMQYWLSNAE